MSLAGWLKEKEKNWRQKSSRGQLKAIKKKLDYIAALNSMQTQLLFSQVSPEFKFVYRDTEVLMYLPYAFKDYIQKEIAYKSAFFEQSLLELSLNYISPGSTILDIGANIGNHTVFWSLFASPLKMFAFEPQMVIASILKRNISLNKCDCVEVIEKVVSDKIAKYDSVFAAGIENFGGSSFFADDIGEYSSITIDSLRFEKVDFIKIDVEGNQDQVLLGMEKTLQSNSPVIMVEIFPQHLKRTNELLIGYGYKQVEAHPETSDYIYIKQ